MAAIVAALASLAQAGHVQTRSGQRHEGKVELAERGLKVGSTLVPLEDVASASFEEPAAARPAATRPAASRPKARPNNGGGLLAEYFSDTGFRNRVMMRIDERISLSHWSNATPDPLVPKGFAVRWTGKITPKYTERYAFHIDTQSGARLWINEESVIQRWPAAPGIFTETFDMKAGQTYDLRMEFRDNAFGAHVSLAWSSKRQEHEFIGGEATTPPAGTHAPTVEILSPAEQALLVAPRRVEVTAEAKSQSSIRMMRLFVDGQLMDTVTQSPWRLTWREPASGHHQIEVRVTDDAGMTAISEMRDIAVSVADGNLPAPWSQLSVGVDRPVGKAAHADGRLTVEASDSNIWADRDRMHVVLQQLQGDGTLTARLDRLHGEAAGTAAGLFIRGDLLPRVAPIALLAYSPDVGLIYSRRETGSADRQNVEVHVELPCYLRLSRHGDNITAYHSADGAAWHSLGTRRVSLESAAFAGLAVMGPESQVAQGIFSELSLSRGSPVMVSTGRGVLLTSGSFLAGQVRQADRETVRIDGGTSASIPRQNVARILYRPLTEEAAARLNGGRPGIVLANGDFLDGELERISGNQAAIQSVLFGQRRFSTGEDAMAVILRDLRPAACAYEVRTRDGSVLRASAVTIDRDRLKVMEITGLTIHLRAGEIARMAVAE